jgi:hypothetical protein
LVGLALLATLGSLVTLTRLVSWWRLGGWPPHDATSHWLAGVHLREGSEVYGEWAGAFNYLMFLYGPPWVVLYGALSFLPLDVLAVGILIVQILALRFVMGSWIATGLIAWLPIVFDNLSTGNIDFTVAAVLLASVRAVPGSGAAAAFFAFAKFSPALAITRRTLASAVIGAAIAISITVPWLYLWPAWIAMLLGLSDASFVTVPILPRVPLVLALLVVRRPWSTAAAAALATPAFSFHSLVLLLPAARLWLESITAPHRPGSSAVPINGGRFEEARAE